MVEVINIVCNNVVDDYSVNKKDIVVCVAVDSCE